MQNATRRPLSDFIAPNGLSYGIVQPGAECIHGVPMLRVKDLVIGSDLGDVMHVDRTVEERYRRTRLVGGELLLSVVGSPGVTRVVGSDLAGFNVARAIAVIRLEGIEPEWVDLCFSTSGVQAQISASLNTTVQATLNLADVRKVEIDVPARRHRSAVIEVLGALDDKIAANGALVSSAEALRRTAWAGTARRARLLPLSSLAQFVNGGAYTKGATGSGRVVIRIAELNNGIGISTVYNDLEVPDRQVAHAGDLLMSWSGSLTAVRWYRDDAIVNQHIFKVIPRDGHPLWAVACAVESKLDEFREIAAGKATTMGHIKRADLDSAVAWPEISDRLNDAGALLWDRALAAEKENLRLAATRDELLPLLMSGKITIKDAEKTVEEVV